MKTSGVDVPLRASDRDDERRELVRELERQMKERELTIRSPDGKLLYKATPSPLVGGSGLILGASVVYDVAGQPASDEPSDSQLLRDAKETVRVLRSLERTNVELRERLRMSQGEMRAMAEELSELRRAAAQPPRVKLDCAVPDMLGVRRIELSEEV